MKLYFNKTVLLKGTVRIFKMPDKSQLFCIFFFLLKTLEMETFPFAE